MTRYIWCCAFSIGLFLGGCTEQFFFNQTRKLPRDGWAYQDTASFSFDIVDTTDRYDLMFDLKHGQSFEYQNLYIKIETVFPNQNQVSKTLSIDLADSKGQWYGNCGSSNCNLRVVLQENAFFNQIGNHQIKIAQNMRVDPVTEIAEIRFLLRQR